MGKEYNEFKAGIEFAKEYYRSKINPILNEDTLVCVDDDLSEYERIVDINGIHNILNCDPVEQQKLPNGIDIIKLSNLLSYSDRYDIRIDFTNDIGAVVYVGKEGVDLCDYGGDFDFAVDSSLGYLERVNKKKSYIMCECKSECKNLDCAIIKCKKGNKKQ